MAAVITPAINANEAYSRSDIARLTGRSADVIRSWETRYDLPRIAGPGHPRYRGADVLKVLENFSPKTAKRKAPRRMPNPEAQLADLKGIR
jgi:hypothetical protein